MPYIHPTRREALRKYDKIRTSGELNYALTEVCNQYIHTHGLKYASINDVLGALAGAQQEFYRRVAAPYEDAAIERNGDVYDVVG